MRRIPLLVAAALSACTLAASADAGGIGFRLAVVNVDGTHRQRLMTDLQVDLLDFSPDRRRVVFGRGCGVCKTGLYVSSPNETNARRILATQAQIFPASWSPDGRRIAFGVVGGLTAATTCGQSVWTIRADGSDLHLVSDCAILARDSGTNEQPWSPDSSRLVFVALVQPPNINVAHLAVANFDGTGRRDFASPVQVTDAAWSPRGDQVAFATRPGGKAPLYRLGVIDVGNGSVTPLGLGSSPTWSRGGRQFAFVDGSGRYPSRAYVGKVSFGRGGPHRSRLRTTYIVGSNLIAWSPNDRALAFVGCRASRFCKQPEVYYVASDGSRLHQITNEHDIATVEFDGLWWAPSGGRLFFSRFRLGA